MTLVYINGRFLTRRLAGVDRFALETVRALDLFLKQSGRSDTSNFTLLVPPGVERIPELEHISILQAGTRTGVLWEQFDLPATAGKRLLVNLCNTGPIFRRNQLTVIHDVAPSRVPESYGFLFRAWYRLLIPILYRRSRSVCTVSAFSRDELTDLHGTRGDICVLPEGADHMGRLAADPAVLERHGLNGRPYVLAVSSLSPHKNFAAVVRAVEAMGEVDFYVVIAGGQNPRVFAGSSGDLPPSVKYVGYVSDEELKALYENAACFVFPSIYEGYGLPPTEAMACGCPVVAARAASIPEVCGDAAIYFDPHDPVDLARVLASVMGDPGLRGKLREKGFARAGTMLWRNAALSLLNEIHRVAS